MVKVYSLEKYSEYKKEKENYNDFIEIKINL